MLSDTIFRVLVQIAQNLGMDARRELGREATEPQLKREKRREATADAGGHRVQWPASPSLHCAASLNYCAPLALFGPPARFFGSLARLLGPPARLFGPPARLFGPPARFLGPPTRLSCNASHDLFCLALDRFNVLGRQSHECDDLAFN